MMINDVKVGDTLWLHITGTGPTSNTRAEELQKKHPTAVVEKKGRKYIYCRLKNGYSTERFHYEDWAGKLYGNCLVAEAYSAFSIKVIAFKTEKEMRESVRRLELINKLRTHLEARYQITDKAFCPSDYPLENVEQACSLLGMEE